MWVRWTLTGLALAALALFIVLPLAAVFVQAFEKGWQAYRDAIVQPETVSAIELSLLAVGISVPLNLLFGLAAAWAITKFQFTGKNVLTTLIDIPFGVSPVISGLVYRAGIRRARLVRLLADRSTISTSFSRFRESFSPPPSSPFRSWRAN